MQKLLRLVKGIRDRLVYIVQAVFGPPYRAIKRVLLGWRDRFDGGVETGATWWQRIWGEAPKEAGSGLFRPDHRGLPLVAAMLLGVLWYAVSLNEAVDVNGGGSVAIAIGIYIASLVLVFVTSSAKPESVWSWFLAENGRRVSMIWWERGIALLSLGAIAAGIVSRPDLIVLGIAGLIGAVPLLASEYDEREQERWAPPLLVDDDDEELPSDSVSRIFQWTMPQLVMNGGSHRLEVKVSEGQYKLAKSENPANEWVNGVPQWVKWVDLDSREVLRTARDLRRVAEESGYSTFAELQCVLGFAQSIEYVHDDVSTEHADYWRYAIETLYDQIGDCEDSTILAATVLRAMGHKTAILDMPGHAALGIAAPPGSPGEYFTHSGVDYYYAETTAEGALIGFLPPDTDAADIRVTPLT